MTDTASPMQLDWPRLPWQGPGAHKLRQSPLELGQQLKGNRYRVIWTGQVADQAVIIKRLESRSLWRYLWQRGKRHPCTVEFSNLIGARSRHLPVPEPLARAALPDGSGVLIMKALPAGQSLYDLAGTIPSANHLSKRVHHNLGTALDNLFKQGVVHEDFHSGNIHVCHDENIYFLDWARVRFKEHPLTSKEKAKQLTHLFASLEALTVSQLYRIFRAVFPGYTRARGFQVFREIMQNREKIWDRHFASRSKRIFRGSQFRSHSFADGILVTRQDVDAEALKSLVYDLYGGEYAGSVLKDSPETLVVGGLDAKPRMLVAKLYRSRGFWRKLKACFGSGRLRQAAAHALNMQARGLGVPALLGLYENRFLGLTTGTGILFMEDCGRTHELDRQVHIHSDEASTLDDLAERLGRTLKHYVKRRVDPKDLKACNLIVTDGMDDDLFLVDLDGIDYKVIGSNEQLRWAFQLHHSLPRSFGKVRRLRVMASLPGFKERHARRQALKLIFENAQELHWVSPEGDRVESFL